MGGMQGQASDIAIQATIGFMKKQLAERIAFHTGKSSHRSKRTPIATVVHRTRH